MKFTNLSCRIIEKLYADRASMANFYAKIVLLFPKGSFYAEMCLKLPSVSLYTKSSHNFMPTALIKESHPNWVH